jgi:hypothetical protein
LRKKHPRAAAVHGHHAARWRTNCKDPAIVTARMAMLFLLLREYNYNKLLLLQVNQERGNPQKKTKKTGINMPTTWNTAYTTALLPAVLFPKFKRRRRRRSSILQI